MKKIITIILSVFLLPSFASNFVFAGENETYFSYTVHGKTLWCVRDVSSGDYDPGYKNEQSAIDQSLEINGYVNRGEHRNLCF